MKTVYVVGGFGRNYGDLVLQESLFGRLRRFASGPINIVPIDCQATRFHEGLVDLINETGSLLIVGGGGFIFHRPEDKSVSGWQFNISISLLKKLRVPLVVYGIGYNRFFFDDRGFKKELTPHLQQTQLHAELFSTRDAGSRSELVRLGLSENDIEVIPDPAIFSQAITPSDLPILTKSALKIGLNWAGDRNYYRFPEPWVEAREKEIGIISGALRIFAEKNDAVFYWIPHLAGVDAEVEHKFRSRLGDLLVNIEEEMAWLYPPSLINARFLTGVYGQMDLVLGMRGHANIIPFGQEVPFIALGSHDKNRFFLEQIGNPENIFDAVRDSKNSDIDYLLSILNRLKRETAALKFQYRMKFKELSLAADAFDRKVAELMS
jgi:hypothetical protein